jgi:hypothetical protein
MPEPGKTASWRTGGNRDPSSAPRSRRPGRAGPDAGDRDRRVRVPAAPSDAAEELLPGAGRLHRLSASRPPRPSLGCHPRLSTPATPTCSRPGSASCSHTSPPSTIPAPASRPSPSVSRVSGRHPGTRCTTTTPVPSSERRWRSWPPTAAKSARSPCRSTATTPMTSCRPARQGTLPASRPAHRRRSPPTRPA